ncbi:MAG: target of Sbf, partial [Watsoniomyces obsoletus]
IAYSNFGTSGSYNRVTAMDNNGCQSTPQSYGGGMAPFDKEISWHFRGPMHINQFASYTLGSESGSKTKREESHHNLQRHAHQRFHDKYERDLGDAPEPMQKGRRALGDPVTATINGVVVTMVDTWSGQSAAPAPAPAAGPADQGNSGARVDNSGSNSQGSSSDGSSSSNPAPQMNAGSGNWGRQGYFNAATGETQGLAFLNNKGGDACSGTFDYKYGNSLSYASADGKTCSPSLQILKNGWLDDSIEVALFTDAPCERGSCGFSRPKSVAHHGFSGQSKMFLLEFDMPVTGGKGFNMDMPAAWILNADIPRTAQYANPAQCSCWTSGCGEFDIFEVLDSGNMKCKSTWHGAKSHGDSNYFARPTSGSQKAVVILDGRRPHAMLVELFTEYGAGTLVKA